MPKHFSNYLHENKVLIGISFGISVGFILLYSFIFRHWVYDDAFITFRYAQNFIHGNGIVYNVDERTEGYTSFLWLLVVSIGEYIGHPVIFSQLIGLIFSISIVCLILVLPLFIPEIKAKTAAIAAILTTLNGVFNPWPMSGIETTFFTLLLLISVILFVYAHNRSSNLLLATTGIVLALLSMTRPEGLLITGIVIFFECVISLKQKNIKTFIALVLPFLILFGVYFGWRYSYYGYLLPNTFYAKVGTRLSQISRGLNYACRFNFYIIPWVLVIGTWLTKKQDALRNTLFVPLALAIIVFWSLYVIAVGGDYMLSFRFFAPIIPLFGLVTAHALTQLSPKNEKIFAVLNLMLLFHFFIFWFNPVFSINLYYDTVAAEGKEVGLWIKENTPEDTVIAVNTAGATAYYSERYTLDMLGLNDTYLAHLPQEKTWKGSDFAGHEIGDGDYVLSRQPDLIIFDAARGSAVPYFKGDIELYENPEFQSLYNLKEIELPSGKIFTAYWKIK